jgi:hypothetical protein
MTKSDVATVLALITAFDRRTTGEADVEAWHLVIGDLRLEDCVAAVRQHFTASRDWLMPVDVRTGVTRIRRQRLEAHGEPYVDHDPNDAEGWRAALVEARRRVMDGETITTPALTTGSHPTSALVVGQPIPRPDYADAPRKAREHLQRAARERVEEDPAVQAEIRQRRAEARAEVDERRRHDEPTRDESPMRQASPADNATRART